MPGVTEDVRKREVVADTSVEKLVVSEWNIHVPSSATNFSVASCTVVKKPVTLATVKLASMSVSTS